MPKRISAVVFDMDGLMIDTEHPIQACCQEVATQLGFDLASDFYERELVGRSWSDCDAALLTRFGHAFPLTRFKHEFDRLWSVHISLHGIATKPGLIELLDFVDAAKLGKAVATSTNRSEAEASLCAAGIRHRFTTLVTGDEVERGKPEPDIYLVAAKRLGVPAAECVAFEDSNPGVIAASRAGMLTFMVPDAPRVPAPEARLAAYAVIDTLLDSFRLLKDLLRSPPE